MNTQNSIFKSISITIIFSICFVFTLSIFTKKACSEVYVFDSHNQFLGILVNTSIYKVNDIKIFVPDINKSIYFRAVGENYETLEPFNIMSSTHQRLYYSSYNCSGQPYASDGLILYNDVIIGKNNLYYGIDFQNIYPIIARSYRALSGDECKRLDENIIVKLPLEPIELPFQNPAYLPLKFSYVKNQNTNNFDVNSDGRIGVEEAIHCLQVLTEAGKVGGKAEN